MSRVASVFGVVWLAVTASAQNPPPDVEGKDAQAIFTSKVNLVMVPVVVRDKQGHAIGTLKKEDFQLFDRGRPQVITRFQIEAASDRAKPVEIAPDVPAELKESPKTPGAVVPTQFTAYLFDDLHLDLGDLVELRNAAIKHLTGNMRPVERIAVYTTSGQRMLDFTDDLEKIKEAMMQLAPHPSAAASECPPMSFYEADLIVNKGDTAALNLAAQDAAGCSRLLTNGVAGPNGAGGPDRVASNIALAAASHTIDLQSQDVKRAMQVLKETARRMATMPGERALILISPGFFVDDATRTDETDVIDRAIRANVVIGTLDARGLYAAPPHVDQSSERNLLESTAATLNSEVMRELAAGTGGVFIENSNDFHEALRRTSEPPEFIYLLGFSPQNLKLDGKYHELKVSLNVKDGSNLIARRGYFAPKHEANEAELAQDEIREAVFSREEMQDIPLEVQTQFFKADDGTARIGLVTKIDLKALHFKKDAGLNKNSLTIVAAVFDHNGNIVKGVERKLDINLKDATFEERLNSGVTVRLALNITPGSYVVRVVLRDQEGKMMTARNRTVEIPY